MKNKMKAVVMGMFAATMIVGCSGAGGAGEEAQSPPAETPTPTPTENAPAEFDPSSATGEIVISVNFSEADFKRRYIDIITKQFPNVTVKQLVTSKDFTFADVVASNTQMDIIDQGITNLKSIIDLNLALDLDPLAKEQNIDLNRFDPFIVDDIRSYAANGELYLIPYTIQPFVLHYNKAIFDKFGVDYPKPNSTWEELIELSKELSRTQDGVNYRGLHAGINVNRLQMQLSLPYVDAASGKSVVGSNEGWSKLFQTYKDIYGVPGNFPEGATLGDGNNAFIKDQNLAMFPHLISVHSSAWVEAINAGMDIGVTTYPVFKDAPGIGTGLFGGGLAISTTSKQPELALEIIKYYTSDEVQSELATLGLATPLVNPDVRNKLYEGNAVAGLVDVNVLYENQFAAPYAKSKWDAAAATKVTEGLTRVVTENVDINTVLREVDEAVNQAISENP
ncbi:extracellular solute-binding protein [Paenibacillus sp.]|uniref:ABC transporter substrate-binding protein n=1 Tax=Paenibacillus sp. TaxID=58172 RepID=UPI0028123720|nr:extracellular solute-binding protein [Paenibacillus sp.]